mmetsp:Transcript_12745/g.24071  ORF Transcript_12745/g.24071 Transcript_12745/m.24071 type:complete len:240 (-) Transcript_12745:592-1311(-)
MGRCSDSAIVCASDVLPTPGGPTRHRMDAGPSFAFLSSDLSCSTARYSNILFFTGFNPKCLSSMIDIALNRMCLPLWSIALSSELLCQGISEMHSSHLLIWMSPGCGGILLAAFALLNSLMASLYSLPSGRLSSFSSSSSHSFPSSLACWREDLLLILPTLLLLLPPALPLLFSPPPKPILKGKDDPFEIPFNISVNTATLALGYIATSTSRRWALDMSLSRSGDARSKSLTCVAHTCT